MVGFPLFTDNHVRQPIVDGLMARGWDVVRAIDVFPEGTDDDVLFAYAAKGSRVFVTSDKGVHVVAMDWLEAQRPFYMIFWKHQHHQRMSDGDLIRAVEELTTKPGVFAYPIEYIKPK